MDWASTWKAVCIAWQQGPVQQIVQCLQHADSDGLTEGAQDVFSNAMSRTEQHVHARLPASYAYRLYSCLCKAVERQGHGCSEAMMELLSEALCSTDGPDSQASQAGHTLTTPRCFFYGQQALDHPHSRSLRRHLGITAASSASPRPAPESSAPGSSASSADQARHTGAAPESKKPHAAPSQACVAVPPPGHVLVLASRNVLEGGTGCHVWPAGMWLAQWLLNHPHVVKGRRCVELGAGTGVVGMIAARLGAAQVTLTDGNQAALRNARATLLLNRLGSLDGAGAHPAGGSAPPAPGALHCGLSPGEAAEAKEPRRAQPRHDEDCCGQAGGEPERERGRGAAADVVVRELHWGAEAVDADVVLAADVVYDHEAMHDLAVQLRAQLAGPSERAYVATAVRCEETLERFLEECARHEVQAEVVETALMEEVERFAVQFHHCCMFEGSHKVVLHALTSAGGC